MKRLSSSVAAAALAVSVMAAATPASASTVTLETFSLINGRGTISATDTGIDANWFGQSTAMFATFNVGSAFDLILKSFLRYGRPSETSAYTLDVFDAETGTYRRLTTDTAFCNGALDPIKGRCNTLATGTVGQAAAAARAGDTLFTGLFAGTYRLGIFDSPTIAMASFEVSVVPLPAGGVLLGSGLALLGLGRRMRRQRAA